MVSCAIASLVSFMVRASVASTAPARIHASAMEKHACSRVVHSDTYECHVLATTTKTTIVAFVGTGGIAGRFCHSEQRSPPPPPGTLNGLREGLVGLASLQPAVQTFASLLLERPIRILDPPQKWKCRAVRHSHFVSANVGTDHIGIHLAQPIPHLFLAASQDGALPDREEGLHLASKFSYLLRMLGIGTQTAAVVTAYRIDAVQD
mmetsp:Transcript_11778/g.32465  ORF Transcript_11778/g.32465 Transcript_11778/m.32465 type:complete len:206 (-) Transcript_11778:436-1053(-)